MRVRENEWLAGMGVGRRTRMPGSRYKYFIEGVNVCMSELAEQSASSVCRPEIYHSRRF